MTQCIEINWETVEPTPVEQGRVPVLFGNANFFKPLLKYHTVRPASLSSSVVRELFDQIIKLRSQNEIIEAVSIISKGNIQLASDVIAHPYRSSIQEIDDYCSQILTYLSATNWEDIFGLLTSQLGLLKKVVGKSQIIPYIDYLSYLYLDERSISTVLKEMLHFSKLLKDPLRQTLVFNFFSKSLEYWIQSKPEELYKNIKTETSALCDEVSSIFDYTYSTSENSPYQLEVCQFLSLLVCFFPSVFTTFMSPTGVKRFTPDAKKLKLLNLIKSQLLAKNVPDSGLASVINFGMVGAKLFRFDPDNSISKFLLILAPDLEIALRNNAKDISPTLIQLNCSFFLSYSVISPEYVLKILHQGLNRSDVEPFVVCFLSTALRALGIIPSALSFYVRCMNENSLALRNLIRKHAQLLLKARAAGNTSSKKSISTSNSETVSLPILTNVFHAFIPHPFSFFESYNNSGSVIRAIADKDLEPILTCMLDTDRDVAQSATKYVKAFIDSLSSIDDINADISFENTNPVMPLYTAAGYFIRALSVNILDIDMKDSRILSILDMINGCFKARAYIAEKFELKRKCYDDITKLESSSKREAIYTSFEAAFLTCSCSQGIEHYKLGVKGLTYALRDGRSTSGENKVLCPLLFNEEQYKELISGNESIIGSVSLQNKIHKSIIKFTVPSDGIVNSWKQIYDLFSMVLDSSSLESIFIKEKRNYAGILASLSECIMASDPETNSSVADIVPLFNEFLNTIIKLLSSKNLYISNAAKDTLSREFSLNTLPTICSSIELILTELLKNDINEDIQCLLDHIISLLGVFIQRCEVEKNRMPLKAISITFKILKYFDKNLNENSIQAIKPKIRLVKLIQDFSRKKVDTQLKASKETLFDAIMILLSWFENATFHEENGVTTISSKKKSNEVNYLFSDLSLECITSISYLTRNSNTILVPQTDSEEDYLLAKSAKYGEIFAVIFKGLEKMQGYSTLISNSSSSFMTKSISTNNSENYTVVNYNLSESHFKRSGAISQFIIQSLTNLLVSNPDVGLKFSLPMGYHQNPKIRSAFLKVFTSITQEGISHKLYEHGEHKFDSLRSLLLNNMSVCTRVCDLCPAQEVDDLANGLLNLYETEGRGLPLLKELVIREIENTTRVVDLLRRNSIATRMLSLYARKYGSRYLTDTLGSILQNFIDQPDQYTFDLTISPDKFGLRERTATENVKRFMKVLNIFANAFCDSFNMMPSSFKEICKVIYDAVAPRFPEAAITSVGSFLFLRFFCPAIVAPQSEGLVNHHLNKDVRKALLMLAKIIQNMANGKLYTLKIPLLYDRMMELNRINDNIANFIRNSAINHPTHLASELTVIDPVSPSDVKTVMENARFIHSFLYNHWDKINKIILGENNQIKGSISSTNHSLTSTKFFAVSDDSQSDYEKLHQLLETIGPPRIIRSSTEATISNASDYSDETERKFQDFMAKNSTKDFGTTLEKQAVHEGVSSDGSLYLIALWGIYDSGAAVDIDMLLYRCFSVLLKLKGRKFSIIFDCTGYTENTTLTADVPLRFNTLCPPSLIENCEGIHYYNVSSDFLPSLKLITENNSTGLILNPYTIPFRFYSSYTEEEDLKSKPFGLSRMARIIINDKRSRFANSSFYDQKTRKFTLAEISVGQEYIQIHQAERIGLKCGESIEFVRTLDVYHATNVKRSYLSHRTGSDNEFSLDLSSGKTVILTSPNQKEIVGAINTTIQRYSENSSSTSSDETAVYSIQDVISIFCNIALASLCSDEADVRTAGYNLAYAINKVFFAVKKIITLPSEGLFIPKNNIHCSLSISEEWVKSSPNMTYSFISNFFKAYDMTTSNRRDLIILYVAPWIPYIHTNVYSQVNGPRKTKYLIRNFLRIYSNSKTQISIFQEYIWKPLCENEDLANIIVDEIINFAIDKQNENGDSEDIISILSICPLHSHCQEITKRLLNISAVPSEEFIEAKALAHVQSNWVEITVLFKATLVLTFNNLEICKAIFPEMVYIGLIFLGRGTFGMRAILKQLIINTFQVFQTDEKLVGTANKLGLLLDKFTNDKVNISLGVSMLNDEKDVSEIAHTPGLVKAIENYSAYFVEYLELVAENKAEAAKWKGKLMSLVEEASFRDDSAVRARALLVMGFLFKDENTDTLLPKVLRLLQKASDPQLVTDPVAVDLNVCIVECLTRISGGLSMKSPWLGKLFWIAFSCVQFCHLELFMSSIKLVATILERMDKNGLFVNGEMIRILSEERKVFGTCFDNIDSLESVKYSPEMFDNYIRANVLKGLFYAPSRSYTMDALARIMAVEVKNLQLYKKIHPVMKREDQIYPALILDMLTIFSVDNKQTKRYADIFEQEAEMVNTGENILVPKVIMDMFEGDLDFALVSGYLELSQYKLIGNDDFVLLRFLRWLITCDSIPLKFLVLSMMEDKFIEIFEHSTSFPIISAAQISLKEITVHPDYNSDLSLYRQKFMDAVDKYGFRNLTIDVFTDPKKINISASIERCSLIKKLLEIAFSIEPSC